MPTAGQVALVTCGGTIAMETGDDGLRRPVRSGAVADLVGSLWGSAVIHVDAGTMDSSQATPSDWRTVVSAVRSAPSDAAVLLTHGTDSLAWTAAALTLLDSRDRTVVLTAANVPLGESGSDATTNITAALAACAALPTGVYVVFAGMPGADAEIFAGGFVHKVRAGGRAFAARGERVGVVSPDGDVLIECLAPPVALKAGPGRFDRSVATMSASPLLSASALIAAGSTADALVLELYACGTVPAEAIAGCRELVADGVEVWACPPAPIDGALYPSSLELADAGVQVRFDLTTELAAAHLTDRQGRRDGFDT
jgi:L-asparaginase